MIPTNQPTPAPSKSPITSSPSTSRAPSGAPTIACWFPFYTESQETGYCLNNLNPMNGIRCFKSKLECCKIEFGNGFVENAEFCLNRDEVSSLRRSTHHSTSHIGG